jgi:hypothetical protein
VIGVADAWSFASVASLARSGPLAQPIAMVLFTTFGLRVIKELRAVMPEPTHDQTSHMPETYQFLLQLVGPVALDPARAIARPTLQALERLCFLMRKGPEEEVIGDLLNAIKRQELGPGAVATDADHNLVLLFAEAARESHPDLSFILKARVISADSKAWAKAESGVREDYLTQAMPSKEVVSAAICFGFAHRDDNESKRQEMSILAHTQKVLDDARDAGLSEYEVLRPALDDAAVMFFESEKNGRPLKRYLNQVNAAMTRAFMAGTKPSDNETGRVTFHDPYLRLILAQAGKLNVFAQSLEETMEMVCDLLTKSQNPNYPSKSFEDMLVHQPSELASLALKTFSMPQAALINSFCFEKEGGATQFTGLNQRMPLSFKLQELNDLLNRIPHDKELRNVAYTNLMAALCTLRINHPDTVKGSPERFDEVLQDLMPHADIEKAHAMLDEDLVKPLNDFIMRKHKNLIDLVSLVDRGRGFREELGI